MKRLFCSLALALSPGLSFAQAPATSAPPVEEEIPFPAHLTVPEAMILTPEETLRTFAVPQGYKVEIVASEPLISTPVAMQFDPAGRLWVVEMNGYMQDLSAKGEDAPVGRIVVLEDTDGDGRMDKSTVFLDKLVMPRAISLRKGGALIAEPPSVYWCPDANGDLIADKKEVVIPAYTAGGNPEHMPNGLLLAMDNWIYNAKSAKRYRFLQNGELKSDTSVFRGQWGISQDDYGRLYYNYNSDQLRADLLPASYLMRNPSLKSPEGVNTQIAKSQKVWPARVTPGVNRGYRKGGLIEGKLAEFTAACGPLIYRGDAMPELRGSSFVCETSANLVKRNVHTEKDGYITAKSATEGSEFLTSTSERFRPVNTSDGPDGALYCVDIARGLVQHITYVTPWLRRQIIERKLEKPIDQGRIWRIVPEKGVARQPAIDLAKASPEQLVGALSSPNGWTRDTAQRLLVEQGASAPVAALEQAAKSAEQPLARLHALWTLEGLEKLTAPTTVAALADADAKVRAAAIRLSELFAKADPGVASKVLALSNDPSVDVQLQLLLTAGELRTPEADALMLGLVTKLAENGLARSATISGLRGREIAFLKTLATAPGWNTASPGKTATVSALARCVLETRKSDALLAVLDLTAQPDWQRAAVVAGLTTNLPKSFKPVKVAKEPAQLANLSPKVAALFVWPGKPGYVEEKAAPPLTAQQQEFVAAGKQLYTAICAACHQPTGLGQEGLAPPVANSEWVQGPESRLIRIVLQGVSGPISVNGKDYNLDMPGLGVAFTDEQIAQILSYTRRDFGNSAPVIDPATVAKVRSATKDRGAAWSAAELEALH